MFTGTKAKVYGVEMPVQRYSIKWQCGCVTKDIEIACASPLAEVEQMNHECPSCYTGPYGNVWD